MRKSFTTERGCYGALYSCRSTGVVMWSVVKCCDDNNYREIRTSSASSPSLLAKPEWPHSPCRSSLSITSRANIEPSWASPVCSALPGCRENIEGSEVCWDFSVWICCSESTYKTAEQHNIYVIYQQTRQYSIAVPGPLTHTTAQAKLTCCP